LAYPFTWHGQNARGLHGGAAGAGHAYFVSIMQDSQDHGSEGCEALSLSLCLPPQLSQGKSLGKQQDFLSLSILQEISKESE